MPEGDTVFKVAKALDRALAGERILKAELRVPAHATADLAGQTITEVVARGKHILLRTDNGLTLHTHLKMEGAWHLGRTRPNDSWDRVRVVIETADWIAVGTELGIVELIATADEPSVVGHLGPDLLGDDWDAGEAVRRLRSLPERPVGEALLDQTVMAGLGNVYRSELCFLRGIDPDTPVGEAKDLEALVALAKRVIEANREAGNQVTTGDDRRGRRQWVYGRAGQPCRRCGTTIKRRAPSDALRDRVLYWCPRCQSGPSAPVAG